MENNKTTSPFYLLPGLCYLAELLIWKTFPPSYALNGVLGALWTLGQMGIWIILLSLYRNLIYNGNRWRTIGVVIAALGASSYVINYLFGYWFNMNTRIFLPAGALLTGTGMVITGIQVLRIRRW